MYYEVTRIPIQNKMPYANSVDFKKLLIKYSLRCESAGSFVESNIIPFSDVYFFYNAIDTVSSLVNKYDSITISLLMESPRIKNLFEEMKAFNAEMKHAINLYYKEILGALMSDTRELATAELIYVIYEGDVYFYHQKYKFPYSKNHLIADIGIPSTASIAYIKKNGSFKLNISNGAAYHALPKYQQSILVKKIFKLLFMKA